MQGKTYPSAPSAIAHTLAPDQAPTCYSPDADQKKSLYFSREPPCVTEATPNASHSSSHRLPLISTFPLVFQPHGTSARMALNARQGSVCAVRGLCRV
jgi:hypothetical protein